MDYAQFAHNLAYLGAILGLRTRYWVIIIVVIIILAAIAYFVRGRNAAV